MSGFQMPITINQAMSHIDQNEYLLPAFQREFLWTTEQIEKLFDSLMRGYPISSMLFWSVKGETKTKWNFYEFVSSHIQGARNRACLNKRATPVNDFIAVLDGQQRLTAMRIGLQGTYAYHEKNQSWNYTPKGFPTRTLYLCLSRYGRDDEEMKYLFEFKKDDVTQKENLYKAGEEIWFRVGYMRDLITSSSYNSYVRKNNFGDIGEEIIDRLFSTICVDKPITYYLEEEQSPDKAVNIFTRINAGGTSLAFADIIFSLMVANWNRIDAKSEINNLKTMVSTNGFDISKDFVVKTFLYLYNNSVKTEIRSVDKNFCKVIEDNWDNIRDCIAATFDLLRTFGFDENTLTSKIATLPIIYYLYHKGIFKNFVTAVKYNDDRKKIKQWLLKVLVCRAFTTATDTVLAQTRKAFTSEISKSKLEGDMTTFPAESISDNLKGRDIITEDYLEQLLDLQKDEKHTFSVLALLYPSLDYKNNSFHKDHLHPKDRYDELPDDIKEKYQFKTYNSIRNLQMLDANENESKGNKYLEAWVNEQAPEASARKDFLEKHMIPDVDLSLGNFDQFIIKRSEMLKNKLKDILL